MSKSILFSRELLFGKCVTDALIVSTRVPCRADFQRHFLSTSMHLKISINNIDYYSLYFDPLFIYLDLFSIEVDIQKIIIFEQQNLFI